MGRQRLLLLILIGTAFIALSGWNWLRELVSRLAMEKTGHELLNGSDIQIRSG